MGVNRPPLWGADPGTPNRAAPVHVRPARWGAASTTAGPQTVRNPATCRDLTPHIKPPFPRTYTPFSDVRLPIGTVSCRSISISPVRPASPKKCNRRESRRGMASGGGLSIRLSAPCGHPAGREHSAFGDLPQPWLARSRQPPARPWHFCQTSSPGLQSEDTAVAQRRCRIRPSVKVRITAFASGVKPNR